MFRKGQIVGVALRSFRGVLDLELYASPTVNYFLAPNGHGKTSVLYAIALALGSSFRDLQSVDSLIHEGATSAAVLVTLAGRGVEAAPAHEEFQRHLRLFGGASGGSGSYPRSALSRGATVAVVAHLARGAGRGRGTLEYVVNFRERLSARRLAGRLAAGYGIAVDNPFQTVMQADAQYLATARPQALLSHFVGFLFPQFRTSMAHLQVLVAQVEGLFAEAAQAHRAAVGAAAALARCAARIARQESAGVWRHGRELFATLAGCVTFLRLADRRLDAQRTLDGLAAGREAVQARLVALNAERAGLEREKAGADARVSRADAQLRALGGALRGRRNEASAARDHYSASRRAHADLLLRRSRSNEADLAAKAARLTALRTRVEDARAQLAELHSQRALLQGELLDMAVAPGASYRLAPEYQALERRQQDLLAAKQRLADARCPFARHRCHLWFSFVDQLAARALSASPGPAFVLSPLALYVRLRGGVAVPPSEARAVLGHALGRTLFAALTNDPGVQAELSRAFARFQSQGGAMAAIVLEDFRGMDLRTADDAAARALAEARAGSVFRRLALGGIPGLARGQRRVVSAADLLVGRPVVLLHLFRALNRVALVSAGASTGGGGAGPAAPFTPADARRFLEQNPALRTIVCDGSVYSADYHGREFVALSREALAGHGDALDAALREARSAADASQGQGQSQDPASDPVPTAGEIDAEIAATVDGIARFRRAEEQRRTGDGAARGRLQAALADVRGRVDSLGQALSAAIQERDGLEHQLASVTAVSDEALALAGAECARHERALKQGLYRAVACVGDAARTYADAAPAVREHRRITAGVQRAAAQIDEARVELSTQDAQAAAFRRATVQPLDADIIRARAALDRVLPVAEYTSQMAGGEVAEALARDRRTILDYLAGIQPKVFEPAAGVLRQALSPGAPGAHSAPGSPGAPDSAALYARIGQDFYAYARARGQDQDQGREPGAAREASQDAAGGPRLSIMQYDEVCVDLLEAYAGSLAAKLCVREEDDAGLEGRTVFEHADALRSRLVEAAARLLVAEYLMLARCGAVLAFARDLRQATEQTLSLASARFAENLQRFGVSGSIRLDGVLQEPSARALLKGCRAAVEARLSPGTYVSSAAAEAPPASSVRAEDAAQCAANLQRCFVELQRLEDALETRTSVTETSASAATDGSQGSASDDSVTESNGEPCSDGASADAGAGAGSGGNDRALAELRHSVTGAVRHILGRKVSHAALAGLVASLAPLSTIAPLNALPSILNAFKPGLVLDTSFARDEVLRGVSLSGGERSVVTLCLLNSLHGQSFTDRVPFRIVDEINQGMDDEFERAAHDMMVRSEHVQYFIGSPKLPPHLVFPDRVTVHLILRRPILCGEGVAGERAANQCTKALY